MENLRDILQSNQIDWQLLWECIYKSKKAIYHNRNPKWTSRGGWKYPAYSEYCPIEIFKSVFNDEGVRIRSYKEAGDLLDLNVPNKSQFVKSIIEKMLIIIQHPRACVKWDIENRAAHQLMLKRADEIENEIGYNMSNIGIQSDPRTSGR